jgi:hypothetical protein
LRRLGAAVLGAALVITPATAALAADGDSDKVEDDVDNCFGAANPLQFDADGDGVGDLCEELVDLFDEFSGTAGVDLVFGDFDTSTLEGAAGNDSLYGLGGDDRLVGGSGLDALIGGPGNDRLTGGSQCDTFAIETRILQRDVIVDFEPGIDRVRFPPESRESSRDYLPSILVGGSEHLEIEFRIFGQPSNTVVFEGFPPHVPIVLSTGPCGDGPPPASICPKPRAFRSMVFVGFDGQFCPGEGELRLNTGVRNIARYGYGVGKRIDEAPDDE